MIIVRFAEMDTMVMLYAKIAEVIVHSVKEFYMWVQTHYIFTLACDCDVLGTNSTVQYCDRYTGQCPCLQNVKGIRCDMCIANHWKIASGEGCEPCGCDSIGSETEQCNPVSVYSDLRRKNCR